MLDHGSLVKPLPSVKDGDLIALARYMVRTQGRETVRVTKVKGHAEDVDVQQGRVRLLDQQENVLLLIWVVVISLRFLLMLGVGCLRLVVIGILLCLIYIDL